MLEIDDLIQKVNEWPAVSLPARLAPFAGEIRVLLKRKFITSAELARRLGKTREVFHRALKAAEKINDELMRSGINPHSEPGQLSVAKQETTRQLVSGSEERRKPHINPPGSPLNFQKAGPKIEMTGNAIYVNGRLVRPTDKDYPDEQTIENLKRGELK